MNVSITNIEFRNAFNFLRALAVGIFEMLICQKIEGDFERGQVALETTYAIIFTPIWILMLALGVLACKVGNN
jgi:hypothetical protein